MKRSGQAPGSTERVLVVPDVHHRQRRPTGAPPPLPKTIGLTGKLWVAAVLLVVVSGAIWLHVTTGALDRLDAVFIRLVTSARTAWLDSLTRGLNWLGSRWGLPTFGLLALALAAVFRRWRHLVVFLVSLAVLEALQHACRSGSILGYSPAMKVLASARALKVLNVRLAAAP